jgi:hypothetical protein
MDSAILRPDGASEFSTEERCSILESWNDPSDDAVSIARARVENVGTSDLLFYCVCTPRFRPEGYESLEEEA